MKQITRTQTGVRLETRLLKVLKALATGLDMPLGELLEGVVLHAFEGKAPFSACDAQADQGAARRLSTRPDRRGFP
jgi:predicted DNA-binding ribbon-helix-helix protein